MINNFPSLTNSLIWFVSKQVLTTLDFIVFDVKSESCEFVLKSFGLEIVFEFLIVQFSPFVCDDISIETLEES